EAARASSHVGAEAAPLLAVGGVQGEEIGEFADAGLPVDDVDGAVDGGRGVDEGIYIALVDGEPPAPFTRGGVERVEVSGVVAEVNDAVDHGRGGIDRAVGLESPALLTRRRIGGDDDAVIAPDEDQTAVDRRGWEESVPRDR